MNMSKQVILTVFMIAAAFRAVPELKVGVSKTGPSADSTSVHYRTVFRSVCSSLFIM